MEKMRIKVNGKLYDVEVEFLDGDGISSNNVSSVKRAETPVIKKTQVSHASGNGVKSPIGGVVKEIKVNVGDNVKENQIVIIIEAMKMNTNVISEVEGTVSKIRVASGDSVKQGQMLIDF
ncbi:MAG: acetyl-CoA carboxylase biotin carboxyl carrier protein subunit [Candidatus Muirbacterium halophilum]|nr:acetyl-CoA carboxylase biotin carboxyl carrier protein subunit [Candidatus Muirbacterium halophilum]MCK9475389.1 acetyl-CoA carboxylase biotin carboxyl carrier protein subunit [Candidatus Muirbacterium halophilum]